METGATTGISTHCVVTWSVIPHLDPPPNLGTWQQLMLLDGATFQPDGVSSSLCPASFFFYSPLPSKYGYDLLC